MSVYAMKLDHWNPAYDENRFVRVERYNYLIDVINEDRNLISQLVQRIEVLEARQPIVYPQPQPYNPYNPVWCNCGIGGPGGVW